MTYKGLEFTPCSGTNIYGQPVASWQVTFPPTEFGLQQIAAAQTPRGVRWLKRTIDRELAERQQGSVSP
jgi:hypothetical protein